MDDQVDDSSVLPTSKQTLSGIRELSIRCRDLLNQMSTLDSITDAADARDIMTSFNIWAANLGIFDEGRLSVAYRLKDAPQVSHLTEKLLIELERYLEDVITMIKTGTYYDGTSSASESENSSTCSSTPSYRLVESSDDDEPLPGQSKGSNIWASIEDTMTGLRQLGLSIRLAGTQHRQERVSRFKKLNGPMYDMFERLAREKIDHNFNKASETLRKRMAESIATRRVRFMYLEKHQNKLSTLSSPEPPLQDSKRIAEHTIYSAQPQLGSQNAEGLPTFEPRALFSQILSETVPTEYNTKEIRPIQKAPERGGSVASVVLNSALPPIPKLDPGGASFACPFCFLVCPANEARGYERWKNHLIHDFEPFFCVYDECSSPFSCSDTFTGLLAHMRDAHTQPKWRCWHCNTTSSPKMFSSADELNDHLENCHSTEVKDSLRSTVLEHSIVSTQHALRDCPFCGGFPIEIEERPSHQDREEALEKLEKHVREHLANVALILAPRETGEPVDTMSDSISDAKAGKNSERDVEGIDEDNELQCLNVSCDCHETEKDSANRWPAYCEIEDESEIERITELWNVISEEKRKEFPDDHESQLACAVKYGFIHQPDNPSRPSSPGMSSTQKSQEDDMGRPASQEIKVWTQADYTVGWICALRQELTAASAMLDEQHPNLSKTADDQNTYTLGSISGHNIVVTCLPKGMIGRISADTAAKYMMVTFPLIKCMLMVGVGAGVPSNEVRLGDVVVGTPNHGNPGVIEWDFGKALGEFEQTAALRDPPKSLLRALAALKVQDTLEGTKIPECLERLKELQPRLASSYLQSASLEDLLFETDCKHVTDPEGEGCKLCDKSMIVKREPREILIHHGLITSGNRVIKDAQLRDKLNHKLGGHVLCFEMDASELGHDLPCLVIRGISDYADSHRNEDWRGHAAFVAAAYAKELLKHLQPRDIESEKPVKDLLSDGHCVTSPVREDVLDWLTTTDYRPQQSEYRSLVPSGTGYWLLDSKECLTWLATHGQFLFCQGIQRIGTFQTSVVIDHLTTRFYGDLDTGLAYIYCNFERRDQQTPDQLFACILKQLAGCLPSLPAAIESLYEAHRIERTRPSLQQVLDTIQAVIVEFSRVFIVIDALDECGVVESSWETIFLELARLQQQHGINVLVTSLVDPNITLEMEPNFSNLVFLDLPASEHDVAEYVDDYLSHLSGPFQENSALRDFVKTVILKSADGMFPLARFHLDPLRHQTTERDIILEIISLVEAESEGDTALVGFYQQTMDKIKQQLPYRAALAKQILVWLTHARRELTVTELQYALFAKSLQRAVGSSDLLDEDELLAMCAGLVTVDRSRNIVKLVHPTLREYLKSRSSDLLPSTEQYIARSCLDYLSLNRFPRDNFTQLQELEEWLASHPFYDYAARHWGHHARESSLPTQELMIFSDDRSAVENSITVLMVGGSSRARTYFADPPKPESVTLLHLATYFQFADLVAELLRAGFHPDSGDSQGRTPLSYAAELGYEAIVSLFLEAGAEADSKGSEEHENKEEESLWPPSNNGGHAGRTPLSFAAEYGHVEASKMLIGHGAGVGSQCSKHDYQGWTPLLFAVYHGHKDVVGLLLRCNADPEQHSMNDEDFGKTPLSHAAEMGHTDIVRMLLEQGANTEPTFISTDPDFVGHTPLWLAAFGGHETVVELLLEIGEVQLDLQDKFGGTILSYMAEQGHEAMVGFISNYWTANHQDNDGRTPLSYAAEEGHYAVVQILLDVGADQYLEDEEGETPRSRAIRNGHLDVAAVLEGVFY
ncbi:Ff.00g033810.m01.CDS01 [Fusarium sp. VM40]|nr:Ff.00g033810.m01.CDS01 [Fusarium sp. VM40]